MVEISIWSDDRYHSIYEDYPEHPYCAPERTKYSYSKELIKNAHMLPFIPVKRVAMERLECGLLLGHIKLMWRLSLDYWSKSTRIPAYFEYRYGINAYAALDELQSLGLAYPDEDYIEGKTIFRLTDTGKYLYEKNLFKLEFFENWTVYETSGSRQYIQSRKKAFKYVILGLENDKELFSLLSNYLCDFPQLKKALFQENFEKYSRPWDIAAESLSNKIGLPKDICLEIIKFIEKKADFEIKRETNSQFEIGGK